MTVHKFKDIIEKEADGELICGSIDNRSRDNQNVIVRRPKFFNFVPILNSKDGIISWNCSYAAKILRECHDKNFNENITGEYEDQRRIEACEIAVKLKKNVDDNLLFLIVMLTVFVNAILQSTIPIFNGDKSAKFLTSWSQNLSSTRFDVSNGIRKRVIYELIFLAIFEVLLIGLYFTPSEASGTNFVQVSMEGLFLFSIAY